jgi:sugar phosphate isomerase/epimerase
MKQGTKNLGVTMGLYARELDKYSKGVDLAKPYLVDLAKAYVRVLEDFTEFAIKNDFDVIEMGTIALIPAESLIPMAADISSRISQFRVVTYHLPSGEINISALHPGIRKEAIEETKKYIDLCQKIGINKVIMHPGCFTAMPDIYLLMKKQAKEIAEKSILEMFNYCRVRDIELSIENLPSNEPLFQTPEEFEPFVDKGIGLVLDTVHAYVSNVEPTEFIRRFGARITEVHLTDGVKRDPVSHYPLGAGEVDCLGILDELRKADFGGPIILEVGGEENVIRSREFLERRAH